MSYSGISGKATVASIQTDLSNNARKLKLYSTQYGSYPTSLDGNYCPTTPTATTDSIYCLSKSGSNLINSYVGTNSVFTLKMNSSSIYYQITESSPPVLTTIVDGSYIQTITTANCPANRTRAVDARDNHTYWVQKLADGKCWMLTNLAYAGGGTNTYGDVKTLTNGAGDNYPPYTIAKYYIVPSTTNYTTEPTNPSISTNGTGQYGYLYNWCAAMGGQTGNGACSDTSSAAVNTAISICPAGWRLPTGGGEGEFGLLNKAVNGGLSNTDAGLRTTWLSQLSGYYAYYYTNVSGQGSFGVYWSSMQISATEASYMDFSSSGSNSGAINGKYHGFAVRCLAI